MFTLSVREDRSDFHSQVESLLKQDLLQEALILAEEQRRDNPLDVETLVILGDVFVRMGELDKARDILTEVDQIISGLSFVYARMADIYKRNGFKNDAALCYRKFMSLNPISQQAAEIAEKLSFLDHQESEASGSDFAGLESNHPKPGFFTMTLAELYIKQGHLQMAREVLGEIAKRDPGNINAVVKLEAVKAAILKVRTGSDKRDCSDNLVKTLSSWLENIDRLNAHAQGK
jgi:tetratricopeptide (TPR) repeat protein